MRTRKTDEVRRLARAIADAATELDAVLEAGGDELPALVLARAAVDLAAINAQLAGVARRVADAGPGTPAAQIEGGEEAPELAGAS